MNGDGEREFGARDAQLALEAVEPGDAERLAGEEIQEDQEPDDGLVDVTTSRSGPRVWTGPVLTMIIMSSLRTSLISAGSVFADAPE